MRTMWKQEIGPRYDSKPVQPEDRGEMTQREIDDERREILESDKFGEMFLEEIGQELTPEQAGELGRLIDDGKKAEAGEYMFKLFYPGVEKIFRWIQEAK